MAIVHRGTPATATVLHEVTQAEGHITTICFKTGPPRRIGVELEWTVHHAHAPEQHLDPALLRRALGPYAPTSMGAAGDPPPTLPGGGTVTVEPGGQLEISSAPAESPAELHPAVAADIDHLRGLLAGAGLVLGEHGTDPHRAPRRLLQTRRYAAMERSFDARGPHGRTMMCSTAGLQVCLDAGTPEQLANRFATLTALGPVLTAVFANSRRHAGHDTGWASSRMAAWLGIDPARTRPVAVGGDPAANWARYALAAPVLSARDDGEHWDPPPGLSFADWIDGALPRRPTVDDLDYHLGTLFPPVRPRGYLEVRYLDAQPGAEWIVPTAVLASLLADDASTDAARAATDAVATRWLPAARDGLADPALRAAAVRVLDVACRGLERTGLPAAVRHQLTETVERRLHRRRDTGRGTRR